MSYEAKARDMLVSGRAMWSEADAQHVAAALAAAWAEGRIAGRAEAFEESAKAAHDHHAAYVVDGEEPFGYENAQDFVNAGRMDCRFEIEDTIRSLASRDREGEMGGGEGGGGTPEKGNATAPVVSGASLPVQPPGSNVAASLTSTTDSSSPPSAPREECGECRGFGWLPGNVEGNCPRCRGTRDDPLAPPILHVVGDIKCPTCRAIWKKWSDGTAQHVPTPLVPVPGKCCDNEPIHQGEPPAAGTVPTPSETKEEGR